MKKILSLIFGSLLLCSTVFSAAEPATLTLDFEKAGLQDFLQAYSKFSGVELVESPEVQKLHTAITLHPNHQVTVKEAIKLMEDAVKEQAGIVIKHLDDKKASATLAKK
jgi:type II secretory pathway component GspD/PulD (secretin)